jgi:hypothetical protein
MGNMKVENKKNLKEDDNVVDISNVKLYDNKE